MTAPERRAAHGTAASQPERLGTRVSPTFRDEMDRIVFRDEAGQRREVPLSRAARLPFERATPIRIPKSHRGKRGMVGQVSFSSSGQVVVFDSKIEMENILLLDFDPRFAALLGQPLRFEIKTTEWEHTPDLFAREQDGSACLFDVKGEEEQNDPANQLIFSRTRSVCEELGWEYEVLGEIREPFRKNLLLLAGFRREPFDPGGLADEVVETCATPTTIAELGHLCSVTAVVRPLVLHLLWRHVLRCDLETRVIDRETRVWVGGADDV